MAQELRKGKWARADHAVERWFQAHHMGSDWSLLGLILGVCFYGGLACTIWAGITEQHAAVQITCILFMCAGFGLAGGAAYHP